MDPYNVLGVSRDADEETIKKAYRELVKKYHPDKYVNTPMADVASEKMKEINRAYDMIMKGEPQQNTQNPYGGYNPFGGYGSYGGGNYTQSSYVNVRALLNMNRVAEAMRMLNQLPKNAEWYYLYGIACMRCGRYDEAIQNIERAVSMEPNNAEYQSALNNIKNRNTAYRNSPFNTTPVQCGGLPLCCTICAISRCAMTRCYC